MTGNIAVMMASFTYNANYDGQDVSHANTGGVSSSVNFILDGTCISSGGGSGGDFAVNWYLPTTANIGNSYWVRATLLSGNAWSIGTMGSWIAITSTRTWTLTAGIQLRSNDTKFEIAADAAGLNIVYTGHITATADGT